MGDPITQLTNIVPYWRPRIKPVDLKEATAEQLEAMKVTPSDTGVGEYVLVLAHDPETLNARTPLFNGIMYSHGGLSRQETELGAVACSVYNRCIYCAAVHASRYNQLTKTEEVIESIFHDETLQSLNERQRNIFEFATNLSKHPTTLDKKDMQTLLDVGLDKSEILDLILATSIFAWANRLMHILGDPIPTE
ncbi:MAG: alkylhydroperoxidase [Dehalococcoidia bacterium]|nr:alkylhydroperoxidase [Dehalococcoidia bacterium]